MVWVRQSATEAGQGRPRVEGKVGHHPKKVRPLHRHQTMVALPSLVPSPGKQGHRKEWNKRPTAQREPPTDPRLHFPRVSPLHQGPGWLICHTHSMSLLVPSHTAFLSASDPSHSLASKGGPNRGLAGLPFWNAAKQCPPSGCKELHEWRGFRVGSGFRPDFQGPCCPKECPTALPWQRRPGKSAL